MRAKVTTVASALYTPNARATGGIHYDYRSN